MTRKVFWEDPYRTELDTRVGSVKGNEITIEETIFFASSGGQESDHGTIGGQRVLEARKDGKEIIYTLEKGHNLKPGDRVHMAIDWERRYSLMRLHFAAEVVLVLVYQHLKGIQKVGAHIARDKARIDFRWQENLSPVLPVIANKARTLVEANHEIVSAFDNAVIEERYWKIEGFSKVPCGGTHLRKTGEIGDIVLKRKNPGKGKERIEIYLIKNQE